MRTLFVLLAFFCLSANAQKDRVKDSLTAITKGNGSDSTKAMANIHLANRCEAKEKEKAFIYFSEAERLGEHANDEELIGEANRNRGRFYVHKLQDFSNALKYINIAITHFEKSKSYSYLSLAYHDKAREVFEPLELTKDEHEALKKYVAYAKIANPKDCVSELYVLGWFETNTGMADSALVHLQESYDRCAKLYKPNSSMFVELLTWIGNAHNMKRNFRKAVECQLRAAENAKAAKNDWGMNDSYRYAAYAYANMKMPDSAIFYLKKCEDYLFTTTAHERIYFVGTELIKHLVRNKRGNEADKYVRILEDTTAFGANWKKAEHIRAWMDAAQFAYYKNKGNHEKALASLMDYQTIKDSLERRRNRANVGEQNLKAEFQKQQEQEKLEQQKKDFETQDKIRGQKIFNYAMIGVVFVVALLLFMAYRNIRDRKKAFAEITKQKDEVERQKTIVETKNKEISDSINYAKRLQEAILPDNTYLKSHFNDSFVFYKPKDVVAGDFYFFEKTDDQIIVAACDCTGHGVPGALVSVVCSNALTRSIKEFGITEPGKLLDKTRELVIETFEKSHANVKDGMDISLISFKNMKGDELEINWSGANNPLWYVQNNELKEIKPHKQSICKNDTYEKFPTHKVTLKKGDTLYLITDGFADQFGGPKGKKFKYKQLQELLQSTITSNLSDQLNTVDQTFASWKGELEQVDDVTVIALRV